MQIMDVSCKELRKRAWNRLADGNYWQSFGASVVGSIVGSIGLIFTAGAMDAGVTNYYIKQQRDQDPEFTEIFGGFERYGSTLGGYILRSIFIFLWSIIPIFGQIFGVWVKPFAYSQMYYFMMDEGLGANDSITKSKEMMNGYKWKLFKLSLSFIGWYLLGALTFGIGMLFLAPYVDATMAEFYAELLRCHGASKESGDDQTSAEAVFDLTDAVETTTPVEETEAPAETAAEETAAEETAAEEPQSEEAPAEDVEPTDEKPEE